MTVASPPPRALLVFDGECGFCRLWVARWRARSGGRLDAAPYQEAAALYPEVPESAFASAVHLIEPDGRVTSGAEAVFRSLKLTGAGGAALWIYEHLPGAAAISEWAYRRVARNRPFFSRMTRLLWGPRVERPEYAAFRCLFVRALGLVYLIAFVSLWIQVQGLIGSRGILPIAPYLEAAARQIGPERFAYMPTLLWLSGGDGALSFLCAGGVALSAAVVLGFLAGPCLAILWAFYLSLTIGCRTFLSFQWDALLLEAGFLAIFAAPWRLRCRLPCAGEPPRAAWWLLRWLLFRLMFTSGVVKLTSGDPSWRDLTALTYHYETQPIPTWTAWYMHQLPLAAQKASALIMFVIELAVPFLIFAPRRPRLLAFVLLAGFQTILMATGNFAFFNLLTLLLCLTLLDDSLLPARLRGASPAAPARALRWATAALAAVVVPVSLVNMADRAGFDLPWPAALRQVDKWQGSFRVVNAYGLFAVMTKSRPEIVVEGSADGAEWKPYEFQWKPGAIDRRPPFVAPHQPRLDWQMWFAALGDYRRNPWFREFLKRLLEGSPPVLALLEKNPFPDAPPRFLRAVVYDYHFTDAAGRRATGAWWRREARGLYCPIVSQPGP